MKRLKQGACIRLVGHWQGQSGSDKSSSPLWQHRARGSQRPSRRSKARQSQHDARNVRLTVYEPPNVNFFSAAPVAALAPNVNVGAAAGAAAGLAPKENVGAVTAGPSPPGAASAAGLLWEEPPNVKLAGAAVARLGAMDGPSLTPLFWALAGEVADCEGGDGGDVDAPALSDVACRAEPWEMSAG